MTTSTRQAMEILSWIQIKCSGRALLQDPKELQQPENSRAKPVPFIPQECALPLPVTQLWPSSSLWGCNTGHHLKTLELQRCCCSCNWFCSPVNKLWKNPGPFSILQRFCWAQTSSTFLTPLNLKTWWSECDSKPADGEGCWERNR